MKSTCHSSAQTRSFLSRAPPVDLGLRHLVKSETPHILASAPSDLGQSPSCQAGPPDCSMNRFHPRSKSAPASALLPWHAPPSLTSQLSLEMTTGRCLMLQEASCPWDAPSKGSVEDKVLVLRAGMAFSLWLEDHSGCSRKGEDLSPRFGLH